MKILVIAPHMDDEVLGVGGTIINHVNNGDDVSVCIIANRAYNNNYNEELIKRERKNSVDAKFCLGYQNQFFLGLKDEQLDSKIIDIVIPLEKIFKEVKPDIVYTCFYGDIHQDHKAVFHATMILCRPISSYPPNEVYCYETPSTTDQTPQLSPWMFLPTRYIELDKHTINKKIKALECYITENKKALHPRSPYGIEIYAKKEGP